MKILLMGYGKMGKAIESIARQRGHEVVGKVDPGAGLSFDFSSPVDVAIEFTQPESAVANIRTCIDRHIPVLSGTTGWMDHKASVDAHCIQNHGTFFYASNYSLGVNIFFALNNHLARLMQTQPYDVRMEEIHHTQKKDAPSGTAITLAEGILRNSVQKKKWVISPSSLSEDLVITSVRKDPAPGTHIITYSSPVDDIEIRHTAHSREGFATGAVMVAEWLPRQQGVLGMGDFLKF
ncbi:MAG TPA: 4-hydroxy-tetrahydrodipicolinate reductase [Cyclobacteriaceae bacterium]|nr:4-hydroxy-tetrahydrodipicolinate reductase [Cyclobacteriaceae bacterium]